MTTRRRHARDGGENRCTHDDYDDQEDVTGGGGELEDHVGLDASLSPGAVGEESSDGRRGGKERGVVVEDVECKREDVCGRCMQRQRSVNAHGVNLVPSVFLLLRSNAIQTRSTCY